MTNMHVIWKRPDGFHSASPADYEAHVLSSGAKLWFHKSDQKAYPFRVSGGWQDERSTERLNQWVYCLHLAPSKLLAKLQTSFEYSEYTDRRKFMEELLQWLQVLSLQAKGDTWEQEIIHITFKDLLQHLEAVQAEFLAAS